MSYLTVTEKYYKVGMISNFYNNPALLEARRIS